MTHDDRNWTVWLIDETPAAIDYWDGKLHSHIIVEAIASGISK